MPSSSSSSASSNAPELTIITRVASIPILAYAIQQVSSTLASNRYTSTPYSTAKGLSASAYKYSEPLQVRLAPLIDAADGYANKTVDFVQSRYPYPFEAQPEEVASYVRERRQSAVDYVEQSRQTANKTIDEKVRTPAIHVVYGIDQRFTPIVDYLEKTAVTHLNTSSAPADTQHQYQRVYVLSRNVTGQLYDYSHQTVLVQRASQTADSITALASTANGRIHALSDSLLSELQRLQQSLAATGASVQHQTTAASHELGETIASLRTIVTTPDLPLNEKVVRVGAEVQGRVRPILDGLLGARAPAQKQTQKQTQRSAGGRKGNGHVQ
ncbi:hypothetical protein B0H15DRAFT_778532 [Mycena belliarum]|uniref:Lipid droplet-associated perilipin protein n=1 Tax=Mycena belliarum TaxID=1033014 RepID=A0AAD6U675_9AGAR|nr:hypothetical protein B0H15DRAFT_778532 [Mycena belliae]